MSAGRSFLQARKRVPRGASGARDLLSPAPAHPAVRVPADADVQCPQPQWPRPSPWVPAGLARAPKKAPDPVSRRRPRGALLPKQRRCHLHENGPRSGRSELCAPLLRPSVQPRRWLHAADSQQWAWPGAAGPPHSGAYPPTSLSPPEDPPSPRVAERFRQSVWE